MYTSFYEIIPSGILSLKYKSNRLDKLLISFVITKKIINNNKNIIWLYLYD